MIIDRLGKGTRRRGSDEGVRSPRRLIEFALLVAVLAVLGTARPVLAQTSYTAFTASYFANRDLSGPPVLVRQEQDINFSYDTGGSPAPDAVGSTDFSIRWERWYNLPDTGKWTFTMTSDDGSRVWIDNNLIIDNWYGHAPLAQSKTLELSAGYHLIKVEYFQHVGGMTAQLAIASPDDADKWQGEYFNNPNLEGSPVVRISSSDLNFNWGAGAPDAALPTDHFSARWTRLMNFAPGSYRFTATADDGIRVWVGDTLLINQWHDEQPTTYAADIYLNGNYPVRVEYYDNTFDALAILSVASSTAVPPPPTGEVWHGKYYNSTNLTEPPALERDDPQINFNWGDGSPGPAVSPDNFSAEWESIRNSPAPGFYSVYVTADDGVRVYVDDKRVVDAWVAQSPAGYSTTVYLNPGPHKWRVEYFEEFGGAQISVQIVPGVSPPPPSNPSPSSGDIVVDAAGTGWVQGGNPVAWRNAPSGYGGTSITANNDAFVQPLENWGRWYPEIKAGNYEVFAYIPKDVATTRNARYWISHAGRIDSVVRSQDGVEDDWVSLGTFNFSGGGSEYISLSDVTYECYLCTTVVWDAIKLSPR